MMMWGEERRKTPNAERPTLNVEFRERLIVVFCHPELVEGSQILALDLHGRFCETRWRLTETPYKDGFPISRYAQFNRNSAIKPNRAIFRSLTVQLVNRTRGARSTNTQNAYASKIDNAQ